MSVARFPRKPSGHHRDNFELRGCIDCINLRGPGPSANTVPQLCAAAYTTCRTARRRTPQRLCEPPTARQHIGAAYAWQPGQRAVKPCRHRTTTISRHHIDLWRRHVGARQPCAPSWQAAAESGQLRDWTHVCPASVCVGALAMALTPQLRRTKMACRIP